MRDRQPTGNILQQEVIEATCSSAQVPTVSVVINGPVPEPTVIVPSTYFPPPQPQPPIDIINIQPPIAPAGRIN